MNTTESKLWLKIKDKLPGEVSRVENLSEDGMPDCNGTYKIDYWIELKICNNKAKQKNVTALLRNTQKTWNFRRGKHGALIFVLVEYTNQNKMLLYRYRHDHFNLNEPELAYAKYPTILKKNNKWQWAVLKNSLITAIDWNIQWCM